MSARDLRPVGPVEHLDRALLVARRGGLGRAARAWGAAATPAATLVAVYYVERVEGVRGLRLPLALLLVFAWCARAVWLAPIVRADAQALWDGLRVPPSAGRAVDVVRTALVVGLGLWAWAWLLVVGALGGALGVAIVLPFFALRGGVAPTWLARAACTEDVGFRAFGRAALDQGGSRVAGIASEALLLAGTLGLAVNLYGLAVFAVTLGRSFFGLEVALVQAFLAPENTLVQLGALLAAFVLVEPLRAASVAARFLDARVREDGLDLRALVDDAVAAGGRAASRSAGRAALALCAAGGLALVSVPAAAQSRPLPKPPTVVTSPDDAARPLDAIKPRSGASPSVAAPSVAPPSVALPAVPYAEGPREAVDDAVRARVAAVLARPEFREFAPERGAGLTELIARLLAWLLRPRDLPLFSAPSLLSLPMPGAWFFALFAGLLFAGVLGYLWRTHRPRAASSDPALATPAAALDVRERPPEALLDEAGTLAARGALREALRALYLATLVALDRRRLITFDPHRTNWQYLRAMPRSEARRLFAEFTRIFDHKWYGAEPTALADYEACRALAARIVAEMAGGGGS